ncbi:hypothetical protein MF406_03570 [Georgenia sp. TF02-10]|uniref:hypothetical protein n=1 Tax=Georgenia sp. TF02-10 TaxID=2917725 RepID=UPI001FA75759|nr:hypothetical protein [Georgenia sp. TF02-10]UNX55361.1 hypothetical protein MF406_03570 [Georgenia sp. TF02-10]
MTEVLRVEALGSLADEVGAGVAAQFARRYLELLPGRLAQLVRAAEAGDASLAHTVTLTLLISSEMVGADTLAEELRDLLGPLRAGDTGQAAAAVGRLAGLADRTAATLADHLPGMTAE